MVRYYVEIITLDLIQISFYIYAWSADQVRDQLRDYEIIALDQTD